ncbi:MAG: TIGR01212 family radical SAM protein [Nitrospirae bacterium]|nr:TIGR01212 family radical SAM protein [Nitrospirota bacterium]
MNPYYRSYSRYLKETFPYKVYKVAIDAGFSCPNIDGTVATGGCSYCDNKSFSPNSRTVPRPIREQILSGMEFYHRRFGAEKFIVYFQAFTNTHGPVGQLKRLYDEALTFPDVVGLSIGTRPDCVPEPVLDLLSDYHCRTQLWIEYGLQSIHDVTMASLNRAHTYDQFLDAVGRTRRRGLRIFTHVILGLPGETPAMMMQTADEVARLNLDGIKIHHLYISKNTALAKLHQHQPIKTLPLEEYIPLACDFLERIPSAVVIERLMGELNEDYVVAPRWGKTKSEILRLIDLEFERRGSRQGIHRLSPVA